MIKFIVAFGKNAFGLTLVAELNPDGTYDYAATLKRAHDMCEGGTVNFAPRVA
jgi:hypothetical protein